ncbi:MAG: hypothetical protein IT290_08670, partial [Deltaproteobacteria bacterium]|nr:hypothetical protein [Deltaproteobacteria bacterium]
LNVDAAPLALLDEDASGGRFQPLRPEKFDVAKPVRRPLSRNEAAFPSLQTETERVLASSARRTGAADRFVPMTAEVVSRSESEQIGAQVSGSSKTQRPSRELVGKPIPHEPPRATGPSGPLLLSRNAERALRQLSEALGELEKGFRAPGALRLSASLSPEGVESSAFRRVADAAADVEQLLESLRPASVRQRDIVQNAVESTRQLLQTLGERGPRAEADVWKAISRMMLDLESMRTLASGGVSDQPALEDIDQPAQNADALAPQAIPRHARESQPEGFGDTSQKVLRVAQQLIPILERLASSPRVTADDVKAVALTEEAIRSLIEQLPELPQRPTMPDGKPLELPKIDIGLLLRNLQALRVVLTADAPLSTSAREALALILPQARAVAQSEVEQRGDSPSAEHQSELKRTSDAVFRGGLSSGPAAQNGETGRAESAVSKTGVSATAANGRATALFADLLLAEPDQAAVRRSPETPRTIPQLTTTEAFGRIAAAIAGGATGEAASPARMAQNSGSRSVSGDTSSSPTGRPNTLPETLGGTRPNPGPSQDFAPDSEPVQPSARSVDVPELLRRQGVTFREGSPLRDRDVAAAVRAFAPLVQERGVAAARHAIRDAGSRGALPESQTQALLAAVGNANLRQDITEQVDRMLRGQEALSKLNVLMQSLGEPAFLLFPSLLEGLLKGAEVTIAPPNQGAIAGQGRGEKPDESQESAVENESKTHEKRGERERRKAFQNFSISVTLPNLGTVEVDFRESLEGALLKLSCDTENVGAFVEERTTELRPIFQELCIPLRSVRVDVSPRKSVRPDWLRSILAAGAEE